MERVRIIDSINLGVDGRNIWKWQIEKQLQRYDQIKIGKASYRIVTVKFEVEVQTVLVSSKLS